MCKVSNDNTYKFLSVDDLDASVRGSEEKASFFLYSGAGNKPPPSFSSANSSATSSVISPKVNSPVRNPVHNSDLFNTNDPPDEIDGEEVITGARKLTVNSMLSNSTNGGNSPKKSNNSFLSRIWGTIHEIAFIYWWKNPGIYLLCLATGVRLGGGYIWSSYTGVFFSDLFATQEDSIHCSYSYNPDDPHPDVNNVCGSDYPYCVDGDCKVLTEFPWHNQGMSAMHIESYMSWVPIVGSALGSFLGGLISDKITSYCDSTAGTGKAISVLFLYFSNRSACLTRIVDEYEVWISYCYSSIHLCNLGINLITISCHFVLSGLSWVLPHLHCQWYRKALRPVNHSSSSNLTRNRWERCIWDKP
jgi:hypothetical protein